MPDLRKTISDREYDKFTLNSQMLTAIRAVVEGNFSFSGLRNGGKITEVTIDDSSWTALPLTALVDRNALSIQNISSVEIAIQYDNSVVGYSGVKIAVGGERFYDITDDIIIYAKSSLGSATITVEELS